MPPLALASEVHVERRHRQEVEERGVVGSRPERVEREVLPLAKRALLVVGLGLGDRAIEASR